MIKLKCLFCRSGLIVKGIGRFSFDIACFFNTGAIGRIVSECPKKGR